MQDMGFTNNNLFYLFSDESGQDATCRYGTIAVLSGSKSSTYELNNRLKSILKERNELKFSKIKSRIEINNAKLILKESLRFIKTKEIRIDIIIWDKRDKRCQVKNRDDNRNFEIMYYRVLCHALKNWGSSLNWMFFPDQYSSIQWGDLIKFVETKYLSEKPTNNNTLFSTHEEQIIRDIRACKPLDSAQWHIIQLVDIYAGLARISVEHKEAYNYWLTNTCDNSSLFPVGDNLKTVSKSQEHKFEVISYFVQSVLSLRLENVFSKSGYLKTYNPIRLLNFWHYEPQGSYDKAPQKHKIRC